MWHTDLAATPTIRWLLTVLLRLPACWRAARPKAARIPNGPEDQPGWLVNRIALGEAVIPKLRSLGYTQ